MASYLPPTESLPIFDSGVFDISNTAYLTYTSAKQLFVTYPIAQGSATIGQLYSAAIDTTTPSSIFNFLPSQTANIRIGNTTTGSGTIRLGAYTGTSVHCGAVDCTDNSINNYVATTGDLNICNNQTSGTLNIGTGARTTSGTINIGTGSGATANPITIGGNSSQITFNNGPILASGKYITTSHTGTVTAPTSTQVGGVITGVDIASPTFPSTGNITSWASITLTPGTWIIMVTRQYTSSANSTRILFSLGTTLRNNAPSPDATDYSYGVTSVPLNNTNNFVTLTSNASLTSNTTIYFDIYAQYTSAPALSTAYALFRAVRIA